MSIFLRKFKGVKETLSQTCFCSKKLFSFGVQLTKALWTFLPDWAVWSDGTRGENWRSLKGYFCEWFWFLSSYIPHVSMHFEKGRRLNVGTLVSAEKVPESLDFCHHDLSARFVLNEYSSFSHVSPMLECLGWDSPKDRRLLLQASMFYKIYMGDVATPFPTRVNRSPNHQLP